MPTKLFLKNMILSILLCISLSATSFLYAMHSQELLHAARDNNVLKAKSLLAKGFDKNVRDHYQRTALHWAVWNGQEEIVRLLLSYNNFTDWLFGKGIADVNATDKDEFTPLHNACIRGHESLVQLLLNYGAHIHAQSKNYVTPLHHAALYGHESIIRLLLDRNAYINTEDRWKRTPLHWISLTWNDAQIIRLLFEYCAHVDAQDEDGNTPLHDASMNNNEAVVEVLLQLGADPNIQNKAGKTAADIAKNMQIKDLISQAQQGIIPEDIE